MPWAFAAPDHAPLAQPLPLQVVGLPLLLWRPAGGEAVALLDRCPHRRLPLSQGQARGDRLVCAYHGWAFGPDGACLERPAECSEGGWPAPVPAFALAQASGAWWVALGEAEGPPEEEGPWAWHAHPVALGPEALLAQLEGRLADWPSEGLGLWRSPSGRTRLRLQPVAPWASLLAWAQAPGQPMSHDEAEALRAALGPPEHPEAWPPAPPSRPAEGWGEAWRLGWPDPAQLLAAR